MGDIPTGGKQGARGRAWEWVRRVRNGRARGYPLSCICILRGLTLLLIPIFRFNLSICLLSKHYGHVIATSLLTLLAQQSL